MHTYGLHPISTHSYQSGVLSINQETIIRKFSHQLSAPYIQYRFPSRILIKTQSQLAYLLTYLLNVIDDLSECVMSETGICDSSWLIELRFYIPPDKK